MARVLSGWLPDVSLAADPVPIPATMSAAHGPTHPLRWAGPAFSQAQRRRGWIALLPLGLLVLSIIALAAYTTSIFLEIRAVRVASRTVDVPALRAVQDLVLAIAQEIEGLYVNRLTGDPVALSDYATSAAARRRAAANLEPLNRELDSDPRRQVQDLLRLNRQWEETAPDPATLARLSPEEMDRRLREVQVLYRSILQEAGAIQNNLRREIEAARDHIDASEERAWIFTLGLAVLALTATLLVLWLVRWVWRLVDISERRRLEAEERHVEAEHRRHEAEIATEDRDRLVRGITHDVKNPLGAADGSAQLLEMGIGGTLTEAQKESVQRIRRSIGASLVIVSDLLELSRAEAGQTEVEVSSTDVATILNETAGEYRSQAEAEGLTLDVQIPVGLPRPITNKEKVREIVGNLLSNAVKFTPPGGRTTLSADIRNGAAGPLQNRCLAISVADTGPGIAAEEQERIFDEFYRGRTQAERTAGLGLGLSISRRIARMIGGDVTVESEPGGGSVFTLWLPLDHESDDRRLGNALERR